MPLELQLNRRKMTQRQKSGDRKVAGGKLRQESYGRKEATERSEPDSEVAEATEVTIGARPFDVAWLCSGKTFTYYITVTAADFQGLFNLSQGFRRNGKEQFIVFAGSEGQFERIPVVKLRNGEEFFGKRQGGTFDKCGETRGPEYVTEVGGDAVGDVHHRVHSGDAGQRQSGLDSGNRSTMLPD